jgi:hypothetical protein
METAEYFSDIDAGAKSTEDAFCVGTHSSADEADYDDDDDDAGDVDSTSEFECDDDGTITEHAWEADVIASIETQRPIVITSNIQRGLSSAVFAATRAGRASIVKVQAPNRNLNGELLAGLCSDYEGMSRITEWFCVVSTATHCIYYVTVMDNSDPPMHDLGALVFPDAPKPPALVEPTATVRRGIMRALLTHLDHLHRVLRIAHRDIKVDNIVIDATGTMVRLIDFGFCVFLEPGMHEPRLECAGPVVGTHTLGPKWFEDVLPFDYTMAHMGTIGSIAPEAVLYAEDIDLTAVDIFAMGVVFYELWSCAEPWGEGAFYRDHFNRRPPDERPVMSGDDWSAWQALYPIERHEDLIPDDVWDLIVAMLTFDPRQRPTARQCRAYPAIAAIAPATAPPPTLMHNLQ